MRHAPIPPVEPLSDLRALRNVRKDAIPASGAPVWQPARSPVTTTSPGVGEVLLCVVASGTCRANWHLCNHDWTWVGIEASLPTVLGRELGGTVVVVGDAVTEGNRVTMPFTYSNGTRADCRRGRSNPTTQLETHGS